MYGICAIYAQIIIIKLLLFRMGREIIIPIIIIIIIMMMMMMMMTIIIDGKVGEHKKGV